ncbi:hypothetical protein [Nonomuraea jiangxiensis]|uniref:Integral membrane protein n=1 Tax=Nonomuraea jiangxiensis TaxID=633440 RepID=A0A1G8KEE3_9ACTN|nr:hypothetical protein [Nonomuraea jiangxiensis]SDI41230.1 hypothetical protein SAMN05421869_105356 [Nonomuraea jiangxiensis]
MDGFLDETRGGVTELRVHGASGTPPAGILNHPHPRLVAGDGTTGFYRRWWAAGPPAGDHADVPDSHHREAYAWGGLTSGGRAIALWLLLLPFSLANVSYFMLPRPPGGTRLRHATEAALRLFALLLTGTLVGAVTRASVDLVGWQCTAAGRACTRESAPGWVHWLGTLWGDEPSKRLAVTALVPLLLVALLWWLARRTWSRDERTVPPLVGGIRSEHPPAGQDEPGGRGEPGAGPSGGHGEGAGGPSSGVRSGVLLARPRLWHGGAPVWRLRVVHVCFALASIGLAVSAPFTGTPRGLMLTVANAGLQLAAAGLAALPSIARRMDPHSSESVPRWLSPACQALRAATLAVLALTIGLALAGMPAQSAARQLPDIGFGAFHIAFTIALGLFVLVTTGVLARRDRGESARRPLCGMGAWFVLMAAAGCANGLSLGVLFWTATFFGAPATPAAPDPLDGRLFLDAPFWWTAALVPLLGAGFAAVALVLWLIRGSHARRLVPELRPYYGERDCVTVARMWSLAALTDRAGLALGVLTGIGVAGTLAVTVIDRFGLFTPDGGLAGLLATVGSWATTAFVVGLVVLGRRTYRDPRLRRTIGIVWDVATFWPRAVHPLAPPCYTERVVPELIARVGDLAETDRDEVVLSGHSQGAVIAAALVPQLGPELRPRVRLLTHGSPLRRLYAAFFPAYFGDDGLSAVRTAVSWCNLYRLSDPIGGPAFRRVDPLAAGKAAPGPAVADAANGDDVDEFCWDPLPARPGRPLPMARWHSDYWLEPSYDAALARLIVVKPAV